MVTELKVLNFGADFFDDPSAFVSQHDRIRNHCITLTQGFVGVANPRSHHVHLNVISLHLSQFNIVLNGKWRTLFFNHRSFNLHNSRLLCL